MNKKKITVLSKTLFVSTTLIIILAGCKHFSAEIRKPDNDSQLLPLEIAGIWQAVDNPWQLEISPEGKLLSARIALGKNTIRPNQTTKVEMIDGQFSTYSAGDCEVHFDIETRVLTVVVIVEHLEVKIGNDGFEGFTIDSFTGPISQDGQRWEPVWDCIFDYGSRFQMAPDAVAVPLIFIKKAGSDDP